MNHTNVSQSLILIFFSLWLFIHVFQCTHFIGFGLTHNTNLLAPNNISRSGCFHNLLSTNTKNEQHTVPSRGGVMSSRTSQQVGMTGAVRGNTVVHSHPSNPHCCACNNAITSSGINNTNSSYTTGQVNMYHGNPNVQNHNNHVHIQQGQEMYHNDRMAHENVHLQQQRHHHNNSQQYGSRGEFQRMSKAPLQDATQYYICECTTCRNLGNSVDICCQCCNCGNVAATIIQEDGEDGEIYSEYPSSRGYTVSSVALTGDTEDTLEVIFDDGEGGTEVIDERGHHPSNIRKFSKGCNNLEGHHHIHRNEEKDLADDITYAHNIAESVHNHQGRHIHKQHSNSVTCNPCSCSGKPVFQGWSSHHVNSSAAHPQHQGMHSTKGNYHHHHHQNSSQGRVNSTNQQNCNVTSPQQQTAQMNSRTIQNHHGHPHYTNSHSPNNSCITNQGRINNNGTHHSKQYNNRVHKAHTCCSQGKDDEHSL